MGTDARVSGVWQALQALGEGLTQAFGSPVPGDPEDQLKSHVRPFIEQSCAALGFPIVAKTESRYAKVGGRPDLGIDVRGALSGHIERHAWLPISYPWYFKLVGWGTVTLGVVAITGIVKRE